MLHAMRPTLQLRLTRASVLPRTRSLSTQVKPPLTVLQTPAPHSGHIRILFLNRPEARNALSRQLVSDLGKQIDAINAEGGLGATRALIIASEIDQAFCSGADLKERKTFTQDETRAFLTHLRKTFTNLANLPVPTISAISSLALGGGLELSLCTSFRVFSSSAIVAQPETRLAIIPGAGGTYRLPGLIGVNRARDMILTGRRVSGPEAYFMGLCDRLVEITPEEEKQEGSARKNVLQVSLELARDLCEGGPIAMTQAIKAVNEWQRGEEAENEAYEVVLKSEDRLEALKAFAEKRKPAFKGR
jgi:methylglutaconyl-CoA hydratase